MNFFPMFIIRFFLRTTKISVVTIPGLLFIVGSFSFGEQVTPYDIPALPDKLSSTNAIELSLEEAVLLALTINYDVQLRQLDVDIAEAEVLSQRGVFEPVAFGEGGTTRQSESNAQDAASGELGVRTRFVTGADLSLSTAFADSSFPESEGRGTARASLTQPLLRGFGIKTTKAQLITARRSHDISRQDLRQQMINTASDVQNTYWDLASVRESLLVQKESLKFARELETLVKQRAETGLVPEGDIVEAQAEAYGREADVVQAEETVRTTEDRIKESLSLFAEPEHWAASIIPITPPSLPDLNPDFLRALRQALERRPDYQSELLRLKNDDLSLYLAKNSLLPKLDLVASSEYQAEGDGAGAGFDALSRGDEDVWSLIFRVELPLGNKEARAARDRAHATREQRVLQLKQLEIQIIREVRRAVDAVRTNRKVVDARAKAVELEQLKLDNEQEKLRLGKSDTDTVVRFIQSLNRARLNHIQSMVRYNQALVRLEQAQGTTLDPFAVVVEK